MASENVSCLQNEAGKWGMDGLEGEHLKVSKTQEIFCIILFSETFPVINP
jgi:hypothetical protein